MDSGFWVLEFKSRFPHSPKSLDFGLWTLDLGLWVLDFVFWVLGFGLWALGFGFKILDFKYCILDFGRWALDFVWPLGLRFWTLDFWSLDSTFGSTLDSELEALVLGF